MNDHDAARRRFLQASGGALGAGWLALHWPQFAAAAEHAHDAATGEAPREFKLLTPAEARDVEAIAAQIVPGGATPGAREAGVVYFLDQIHAGLSAPLGRRVPRRPRRVSARGSRRRTRTLEPLPICPIRSNSRT